MLIMLIEPRESQWQIENDMDEEAVEWEYNKEFKALDITNKDLASWEVLGDSFPVGGSRGTREHNVLNS